MINSENGSVSIYMTIILTILILFFGLLSDLAKIKLAEHEAHIATQAAVRSALSYFDPELEPYGLYAMNQADINRSIAMHTLQKYEEHSQESTFRLSRIRFSDLKAHTYSEHVLANHDIWKRQILEEMKYMAPIEFSIQVMDKFHQTDVRAQLQTATTLYRHIDKLEEMRKNREQTLDRMWDELLYWIAPDGHIPSLHRFYEERFDQLKQLADRIEDYEEEEVMEIIAQLQIAIELLTNRIDDLNSRISSISSSPIDPENEQAVQARAEQLRSLNDRKDRLLAQQRELEDEQEHWRNILDDIRTFHRILQEIDVRLPSDVIQIYEIQETPLALLHEAKQINREMIEFLENLAQGEGESREMIVELENQMIIEASYFQHLETDLALCISLFVSISTNYDGDLIRTGHDYIRQYDGIKSSLNSLQTHLQSFYTHQAAIEAKRQAQNRNVQDEKEEIEEGIASLIKEIEELLYDCEEDVSYAYGQLQEAERKYLFLNANENRWEEPENEHTDIRKTARSMPGLAMKMLEKLQKAMIAVRDDAYTNEYILHYFNYRTSPYARTAQSTQSASHSSASYIAPEPASKPSEHVLPNQEVEYVIYGFSSCRGNHIAAFSEMFAVRMGIRTMEVMLDPNKTKQASHPVLIFLYAAMDGARMAVQDMKDLVAGQEVILSSRLHANITLNYKDYLRLFLALHPRDLRKHARLQSIVQLNTGHNLEEKYTFLQLETEAEVVLWFWPNRLKEIKSVAGWAYY